MAWLPGYSYRRAVYANTTSLGTTETNIPLAVKLSGLVDLTGKCQADFDDCVFTDTDGTTLLDWYWESKVASAPVGTVEVPSLTAGEASLLVGYLYYGNPSAVDQSDEAGTFGSLVARYSMADATDATALDSTANNHDGTSSGGTTSAAGKVGNALTFDKVDSRLTTDADYIGTSAVTVSVWAYPVSYGGANAGRVLDNGKSGLWSRASSTSWSCWCDGATIINAAAGSVTLSAWQHVAVTWSALGVTNIYVNGALSGSADQAGGTPASGTTNVIIGSRASDNTRVFDGLIDEVQVELAVASPARILAKYMAGAGTLFTFGAEELALSGHPALRRLARWPTGFQFDRSRGTVGA